MSFMVSGLSEDSARFPNIGADLSEPWANLPIEPIYQLPYELSRFGPQT